MRQTLKMQLPSFPSGINTDLGPPPPTPIKRPKPKKPRDPRRIFVFYFILAMLAIALYPAVRGFLQR